MLIVNELQHVGLQTEAIQLHGW